MLARVVGGAAAVFYRVDRHGPPVPGGPVMITANHPNSLVDPLLIFRCSERATRPLGRAPLFDRLLLGPVMRALGGIPVHRRQDDPDAMHRNEDTFRAAVGVLVEGGAIQIYPEGRSHSESQLAELRTGAARIALQAEEAAGWRLGLSIVPVGITYSQKESARTGVVVRFGEAFSCTDLEQAHRHDPVMAVRLLTRRIEAGIRAQTLNFVHPGDRALVEMAEQMFARESRWVPWRTRERLGTRFPRLQRFAAGLEWVRRNAPEEHEALTAKVERYAALHSYVKAGAGDVPVKYGVRPVARYLAVRGSLLAMGLPVALAGAALWGPVAAASMVVIKLMRPTFETRAISKLIALFLGAVFAWAAWTVAGYALGGAVAAFSVAALAPLCGYVAMRWKEVAEEMREDALLFVRLQGRPDVRRRFARLRAEITTAFRRLEEKWKQHEAQASSLPEERGRTARGQHGTGRPGQGGLVASSAGSDLPAGSGFSGRPGRRGR